MATSWEHLLGGYATNTLTEEEKRQLFEAALHDQTLFEALADEEALKAILENPEARQRILTSLQAKEHSDGVSKERGGWWGWFRQQSSLAWAGSLAALGLVLIFGWQMEKEWGPVVSQEQEAAKSSSRDEVAFRTQKPSEERKEPIQKENLERKATQLEGVETEGLSTPVPAAPRVDTSKINRLSQVPAVIKRESAASEKGQAIRRLRANEQVAQSPPSSSALNQPKFERSIQPLPAPEGPEVAMPDMASQATAPGRFADLAVEEASVSAPSAQELFYASSGYLADEIIAEKNDIDRVDQGSDQAFRGALSKELKPSSKKKALSFLLEREVVGGAAIPTTRGLRYSFVQHTKDGKEEEVESRQITGNWSEIRLAVESNVSGYLYVLAPLGNGKWQKLVPMEPDKTVKTEGGIKVKSFQRVEYSFIQLINSLGKPFVSKITVLLSPNPIDDLSQLLGTEIDKDGLLIERAEGAVFVVQPTQGKENPLGVGIPLVE